MNSPESYVRVLLVDDQLMVREGIEAALATEPGIKIVGAGANATAAMATLNGNTPDVIVIETDLVEADAFAEIARTRSRFPGIRTVLLVSMLRDWIIRRSLAVPVDGIVAKCDTLRSLRSVIAAATAGRRMYSQAVCNRIGPVESAASRLARLPSPTPREYEVLAALARGRTVREVARELGLAANTVDNHKSRLMRKLAVHSTVELTRYAIREGIVTP